MSFGSSSSSSQQAKPPPFLPVDIASTQNLAEQYSTLGYDMSNADFLKRFPGLVSIRNNEINDAAKQIDAPLDPTVQNSFASSAMSSALGAFGGGQGGIGPKGSAARNAIGVGIANQTQNKEDYDWNTLLQLLSNNPEQSYGLSGGDVLNLLVGNMVGRNQSNFAGYQARVGQANASNAATTQNVYSSAQLGLTILGLAL